MLIPTGFWSYSSEDDESSRGRLSQLRALLAAELQQQIGRAQKVNIFQDVAAIPPGSDWAHQINIAIESASFIIPIITPGFLQSEWCCREIDLFRQKEQALSRNDLVFPIHYLDTDYVDGSNAHDCYDKDVLTFLRSRQFMDFRHLRLRNYEQEDAALFLEKLARGICAALRAPGAQVLSDRPVTVATKTRAMPIDSSETIENPAEAAAERVSVLGASAKGPGKNQALIALATLIILSCFGGALYAGLYFHDQQKAEQQSQKSQESAVHAQQTQAEYQRFADRLEAAGFDRAKLAAFQSACGLECPDDLAQKARAKLQVLDAEATQYKSAGDDVAALKAYEQDCKACEFKNESEMKIVDLQSRQKEAEHQRFADLFEAAGFDRAKLTAFQSACGSSCPGDLAQKAREKLQVLDKEAAQYKSAGEDVAALQAYTQNCQACEFESAAEARIAQLAAQRNQAEHQRLGDQLEAAGFDRTKLSAFQAACGSSCPNDLAQNARVKLQLLDTEATQYKAAGDDRVALNAYVQNCKACEFKATAEQHIADLEKVGAITECDRLAADPNDSDKPPSVVPTKFSRIDVSAAIRACRDAVEQYPRQRRFVSYLARALNAGAKFDEALRLYQEASNAGSAAAMNGLGMMYEGSPEVTRDESNPGIPPDYKEAARFYRKAADAGNSAAMVNLGTLYMDGVGVTQDTKEGARLYRNAADAGSPAGMVDLSRLYQDGTGVTQDYKEAARLLTKAANAGSIQAMDYLGALYAEGLGVAKDYSEAAAFYRKAANGENQDAMYQLSDMYAKGLGVSKDLSQSKYWSRKALEAGRRLDTDDEGLQ